MRRVLAAAGLVLALGVPVLVAAPAPAAAAAVSRGGSSSATARPPQPGEGWLTGRRQRLLAVWILIDVGGLLLWYGSEPARRPKLLGSVGAHRAAPQEEESEEQPVRGIGRFARPRSGPPSRLI